MKKQKILILMLFSFIALSAQEHGQVLINLQGENQMQNTSIEIVPNAQFPFGEPLRILRQQDRTPKKVFVLGVYASAVHAKWRSVQGITLCDALAVASEPYIFWNGENAAEIISRINIPSEAGSLEPANDMYNGSSGRSLDELYLAPLGFSRDDAWLCDLVPHSYMNENQSNAINTHYIQIQNRYNLPTASIPEKPVTLTDEDRRNEIIAELEESGADTVILLGDDPIRWFLSFVSNCNKTRLAEFGKEIYGQQHSMIINGKTYTVIPLAHVRQGGRLGQNIPEWERLHSDWVENMNRRN